MKKIILTEAQAKKLASEVVKEQEDYVLGDGRYHITAICDITEYRATYKGGEISDIGKVKFDVSYLVDIEQDSRGVSDIKIYDIRGPKQIKTVIEYYPWDNNPEEEITTESIIIPLDWQKLDIEKDYEMEYFGVDQNITVYVMDDGQGGLKTKQIEITIKQF